MEREHLPSLADHHTHAQDIVFHNQSAAKAFKINVGDHLYPNVGPEKYAEHVGKNNLDTIWLIFENKEIFSSIKKAIKEKYPDCQVKGFYFIRDPKSFESKEISHLYRNGLLHGIKIHPVIDSYALTSENFEGVIEIAKKFDIPIIFHSDDRKNSMYLTSPDLQKRLVRAHGDVRFVIGHGGAYANPRLVGRKNTAAISYWQRREVSPATLIGNALKLATGEENVFYEFSITTNKTKARIIADFVKDNPKAGAKILAGSDFPTLNARLDSQLLALSKAGLPKKALLEIARNRL